MKKSRFSDEQITRILAELDAGTSDAELARKHGGNLHTIYQWRKKFGAMQARDGRRNFEAKTNRR